MKKIMTMLVILTLSLTACADRHQLIEVSELPTQAQAFIQKHFHISDVAYTEREREGMHYEYNVHLKNNTEIDFDNRGNLQSVDCQSSPVPEGIIPELIATFITLHHPNSFVTEYTIGYRHITIELNSGLELIFDLEGHFLRTDD
jgi:hypothetical protein